MELTQQLNQVVRRLARSPIFTLISLITLAAGVGATIAVFSVVDGVLLKPLPYPQPGELVGVWHSAPGLGIGPVNMAPSNYFIYREQNHVFEDIGLYQGDSVSVTGSGTPEQVAALDVTDGLLPVLGIAPMLGRNFNRADVTPNGPQTVILGYDYWQKHFAGDRGVVGRSITVEGKPRQIIGVMPRNFHFLDWDPRGLFLPLQFDRPKTTLGQFSYEGIARLKPGVTLQEANADIARMIPIVWRSFPPPPGFSVNLFHAARLGPNVRPLRQDVVGDVSQTLWVLLGSIAVVLLIACANVANLLLVRAEGRHQELAICAALGASRWRIAREFLLESAVLGGAGTLLGLGVAWGALHLLVAIAPTGLPRLHDIGIDGTVLLFTLIIALGCSLLFGSIPALRYGGTKMGTGLREGGRTSSQGRARHRTRNALVVVQVGLAFVLLICSGLMIRTFYALTNESPGYDPAAKIENVSLGIPEADVPDSTRVTRMQEAMLHKMEAIPGVTRVAIANSAPMDDNHWQDPVFAEDHNYADGSMPPLRLFKMVSPGYFATLGIPLMAGRDFTWEDLYNRQDVAIVSSSFAREMWGSPDRAPGKRIRVTSRDDWRQIVGVVGDLHDDGMSKPVQPTVWWPLLMNNFESNKDSVRRWVVFAMRSNRAGSQSLANDIRRAVWSVDPNIPLAHVRTQNDLYEKSMARTSFTLVMLALAAGIALLLGLVGLYGVIAYSATQRRREIGIRIAMGAERKHITGMFVRQGLLLAGVGVVCGAGVAMGVTQLLKSLLFHVGTVDPLTYALACAALFGAAALASYVPSRRTASVDPVEALRAE
ncbi:MAG TPA: ABC transporter permease [Acidobacteriaceae bacterium]|nr:ABC transporter permease [Acidobacteriaceae bacterium]